MYRLKQNRWRAGVGKNLQDHPCVLTAFSIKDSAPVKCSTDDVYNSSGDISKRAIANFILFGKGPLTSTGCDRGAFVKTTPEKSQPDLQLRFVAGSYPVPLHGTVWNLLQRISFSNDTCVCSSIR